MKAFSKDKHPKKTKTTVRISYSIGEKANDIQSPELHLYLEKYHVAIM